MMDIKIGKEKSAKQRAKAELEIPEKIVKAWKVAREVRKRAYAPYSAYQVGAALIDEKGNVLAGCNVENASYGATICAERNAMLHAVAEGIQKIRHVVVVTDSEPPAPPCALCLQVLCEFSDEKTRVWLGDLEGVKECLELSELLPRHFGPGSLARGLRARATRLKR